MNPADPGLALTVRVFLRRIAASATTITYQDLANALQLQPPNTIHQLTTALEHTMREDADAGRPFIAALVVSKRPPYRPARGFFQYAAELNRFDGAETNAATFHASELARAQEYWSQDAC